MLGRLMQEAGPSAAQTAEVEATRFTTTRWSLVLRASRPGTPEAAEALEVLCRTYWYPVYAFVRSKRYAPEDAQDLVQEFFARLLEKNWLADVEPGAGKFRYFLLTAVKRFLLNEYDRRTAQKRGGGQALLSIDEKQAEGRYAHEPVTNETPERIFDRRWALTVLDQALTNLRSDLITTSKGKEFAFLGQFLSREAKPGEYRQISGELGLSASAIAVAVHRLRQRYREVLRDCVGNTMA